MSLVTVNKNSYTAESLYQWDINQILEIRGLSLPSIPEIHFTNSTTDKAIVRQGRMDSRGIVTADIPNSLLQKPYKITAFVCIYSGETFETLNTIIIPVNARAKPYDYSIVNDEEVYSFKALENTINNAIAKFETKIDELNDDTQTAISKNADFYNTRVDNLLRNYNDGVLTIRQWDRFAYTISNYISREIKIKTNGAIAKMTIKGIKVNKTDGLNYFGYLGSYDGVIPIEFENTSFVINDVKVVIRANMNDDGKYYVWCATDGTIDFDGTITLYEMLNEFTSPELIDARVGADGKMYNSVGEALRTQLSNMNNSIQKYEFSSNDMSSIDKFYIKPNMIFSVVSPDSSTVFLKNSDDNIIESYTKKTLWGMTSNVNSQNYIVMIIGDSTVMCREDWYLEVSDVATLLVMSGQSNGGA